MSVPQVDVDLSQTIQRKNPQAVAFPIDTQNCTEGHASGGKGFGDNGEPSFTLSKGHSHAVAFTKSKRAQSTTDDETWVPGEVSPTMSCFDQGDTRATTVVAFTQNSRDEVRQINGDGQIAGALSADAGMHQTNYVAYDVHGTLATKGASQTDCHTALRSRPPGQSEASTTTVVATPIDIRQSARGEKDTNNRSDGGPPGTGLGADGDPAFTVSERGQAVAQGFTYSGYSNQPAWMTGDRTDCLPASGHSDGSHQGVGVVGPFGVDFQNCAATGDVSGTIMGEAQKKGGEAGHGVTVPPVQVQWASGGGQTENPTMQALRANAEHNYQFLRQAMAVRRLTPRECERLQGFPDDYTLVEYRKKPAADGPRYRALGNSMAVPVMRWIGERIAAVDRLACPS
jgi:DNA (cytosine-5)-methyltransferase 1